jgi:hypothetical protein
MKRAFLHMLLGIMAIAGHAQVLVVLPGAEEPNMPQSHRSDPWRTDGEAGERAHAFEEGKVSVPLR